MKQAVNTRWANWLAILWLGGLVVVAGLAPYLPLAYPPAVPDLAHLAAPPLSFGHLLGTDAQGWDILASLVFGAHTAVLLTLPATVLAAVLAGLVGSIAGYWGNGLRISLPFWVSLLAGSWGLAHFWGHQYALALAILASIFGIALCYSPIRYQVPDFRLPIDSILHGVLTLLGAVPRLLLVLLVTSQGTTMPQLALVLAVLAWPDMARLVRARMQRVRALPFIEVALASGIPPGRIWLRHALPHALQPLRTAFPLSLATLLGLETTLSFLGLGLPPTTASWGRMLANFRLNLFGSNSTYYSLLALIATIISLHVIAKSRSNTRRKHHIFNALLYLSKFNIR